MMKKIVIGLCLLMMSGLVLAQKKKKPNLLVYGSDLIAFSAAMQSAKSSVPTVWVLDAPVALLDMTRQPITIDSSFDTDGGLWLDILMSMASSKIKDDSIASEVKKNIQPELLVDAISQMLRSQENLTIVYDTKVKALKQNKKDWTIILDNKKRMNVRALVDASNEQELKALLSGDSRRTEVGPLQRVADLSAEQMRGLVASGELNGALYAVQLSNVLAGEQSGFIDLRGVKELIGADKSSLPLASAVGQAIGGTAAYLAFFKTTADKIEVRKLQTELLTYGMRIVPYQDVKVNDANFLAIQKVALVAVLEQSAAKDAFVLERDRYVKIEEVEPVLDALYTRAQLWFMEHKGEYFSWKDFIQLVQFVGLKGDEVKAQIEKEWSTRLKFEGKFDEDALVTRYHFAVILDRYAAPYSKAVNKEGEFKH